MSYRDTLSTSYVLFGHMSIQDTLNDFKGYALSVGHVALILEVGLRRNFFAFFFGFFQGQLSQYAQKNTMHLNLER